MERSASQKHGITLGTHLIGSLCKNVLRQEPIMGGPPSLSHHSEEVEAFFFNAL